MTTTGRSTVYPLYHCSQARLTVLDLPSSLRSAVGIALSRPGAMEMGGAFTVAKIREGLVPLQLP
jgi:hypothetical protein